MGKTLFDKIWDTHVVQAIPDGPTQLYIDRLYCHEVTTPQAFDTIRDKGCGVLRPERVIAMPDHNTQSDCSDRIDDPVGRKQVETLERNCREFGIRCFGLGSPDNGIIHVVGPEKGLSLPGMTIVCGDSHTSTHGAIGAIAMGIGTSEVAQVLASQCILQRKPKTMRINIEGTLSEGVTAKDVALYIMAQMTTSGATGYAVEYAGQVVRNMSMEGRLPMRPLSVGLRDASMRPRGQIGIKPSTSGGSCAATMTPYLTRRLHIMPMTLHRVLPTVPIRVRVLPLTERFLHMNLYRSRSVSS